MTRISIEFVLLRSNSFRPIAYGRIMRIFPAISVSKTDVRTVVIKID